jgi:hypothetical protein
MGALEGPGRLTDHQQAKLAQIQRTNRRLYRAYLLKEQLRVTCRQGPSSRRERLLEGSCVSRPLPVLT